MATGMTNAIAAAGVGTIEIGGVNYVPKLGPGTLKVSRILNSANAINYPAQTVTLYKTVTDGEYVYGIDTRDVQYIKKISIDTGLVVTTSPNIGYEPYLLYLYNGSIYTFGASGTYFKRFSCANLALQATASVATDGHCSSAQQVVGINGALIAKQSGCYYRFDANTLVRSAAVIPGSWVFMRRDTDLYAYVLGTIGGDPYYTTFWRVLTTDGTSEQIIRFNGDLGFAWPVLTDRYLFVRSGGSNSTYVMPIELLQQGVANTAYLNTVGQEVQFQYFLNALTAVSRSTEGGIPQVTLAGVYKATNNSVVLRFSIDSDGTTGFFSQYDTIFILLDGEAGLPDGGLSSNKVYFYAAYTLNGAEVTWGAVPQFCRGRGDFSAWNAGSPVRIILEVIDEVVGLVQEV